MHTRTYIFPYFYEQRWVLFTMVTRNSVVAYIHTAAGYILFILIVVMVSYSGLLCDHGLLRQRVNVRSTTTTQVYYYKYYVINSRFLRGPD